MILQNTNGYDRQVNECLQHALLDKNSNQIQTWMKEFYRPENMFAALRNDKIVSVLQMDPVTVSFAGKDLAARQIVLSATDPDYRQKKVYSQLVHAALTKCENNELMTLCYTEFPALFEKHGFQIVSTTRTYWMSLHNYAHGAMERVQPYRDNIDLYPVYNQFMNVFDGSIRATAEDFRRRLHAAYYLKEKVVFMEDANGKICGFAIYKHDQNAISISCLVYLTTQALQDLFAYLSKRSASLSLTISEQERLEKFFPMDFPREKGSVMVRINDTKLFSRWAGMEIKDAKQAYACLSKPCWNHFYQF
ncbi:MAG: GNAT family N-acetyltransferase [Erysipelotrichaceae bacterium]|nr:GNAT family N-acetyltransferase [Erysipelotrichaceae bacterium]